MVIQSLVLGLGLDCFASLAKTRENARHDVTGGYIITEEETLREAINKIADYIQARVTKRDNVIQLRK